MGQVASSISHAVMDRGFALRGRPGGRGRGGRGLGGASGWVLCGWVLCGVERWGCGSACRCCGGQRWGRGRWVYERAFDVHVHNAWPRVSQCAYGRRITYVHKHTHNPLRASSHVRAGLRPPTWMTTYVLAAATRDPYSWPAASRAAGGAACGASRAAPPCRPHERLSSGGLGSRSVRRSPSGRPCNQHAHVPCLDMESVLRVAVQLQGRVVGLFALAWWSRVAWGPRLRIAVGAGLR